MFKTILIPTDLSPKAAMAIKKAVQLAGLFHAKIILLNVHEEFMDKKEMEMLRVNVGKIQAEFERTAILAKNEMKDILNSLHAEDIKVEYLLKEGKPSKVICREAENLKADLIVMGTNGRDSISDYILGSTAAYVVEHVKIAVLVIPLSV